MNPKIWGPHAWVFLHTITLNYPDNPTPEQKKQYQRFFQSLADVIPCDKCKYNYIKKIKNNPVNVNNRTELVKWLLTIHNDVNKSNGKEELSMSDFIKKYKNLYNSPQEDEIPNKEYIKVEKQYINFIVIALILLVVYSLFRKK